MQKIPKRRNGYYYDGETELVSVTKVLGETLAKPQLLYWYGSQAAKIALKNPELTDKEVMHEFGHIQSQSQERGRFVHTQAEALCRGDFASVSADDSGYSQALLSWWNSAMPKVIESEKVVYAHDIKVAGRLDLYCEINGQGWVIDFKSGKNIYKEVGLQLAFYKHGLNLPVKTGVVLLKESGSFAFQETVDTIEDFKYVLEVWRWIQRK